MISSKVKYFVVIFVCMLNISASQAAHQGYETEKKNTASKNMVGIVLPASPDTLRQYLNKMHTYNIVLVDGLKFYTGTIYNVNVVVSVPPSIGGLTYSGIDCFVLENHFRPNVLIDPGTAGSHLYDLSVGDVVIGARVVNFGNYMTTRTGIIIPGADNLLVGHHEGYKGKKPDFEYLYANRNLVDKAYMAAQHLNLYTSGFFLKAKNGRKAWIVKYGTQGSADTWLRDPKLIRRSSRIFGEIDEAGDWPIALVSCESNVPFIEIHTIANAPLNFPTKINSYFHKCSVFAQDRSNDIVLSMIHEISISKLVIPNHDCNRTPRNLKNYRIKIPQYVNMWTRENR